MGHRTQIVVSVDSEKMLSLRGKIGDHDPGIATSLVHAVAFMKCCPNYPAWGKRDIAMRFRDALDIVASRVTAYDHFDVDPSMDVYVQLDFNTEDGATTIYYKPDMGGMFCGSFMEFKEQYGLEDWA